MRDDPYADFAMRYDWMKFKNPDRDGFFRYWKDTGMKIRNHLNRPCWILITVLLSLGIISACIQNKGLSTDALAPKTNRGDLSEDQFATLSSLKKVDYYPLYTMTYYGEYNQPVASSKIEPPVTPIHFEDVQLAFARPWGCSLFTILSRSEEMLFGRNFDYYYSPALLLFTSPPAGYASVSMVDLAVVGYWWSFTARSIINRPVIKRKALLKAPFVPFDGMNEKGLVIGMAAVPAGRVKPDPRKPTIGQLMVMRKILDTCSSVSEALAVFRAYNIDMQHAMDLLADVSARKTQWSIVYGINTGDIKVSMGRNYKNLYRFNLNIGKDN